MIALALALTGWSCMPPAANRVSPERAAQAEADARRAIANERNIDPAALPARTLGVAPFVVSASDTLVAPLAYGLADLLMTDLARSDQVQVVDRLQLDALLRELDLATSGRVDTATAPRVGKLVGARRLVLGSLTSGSRGDVVIQARIANAATQEIRQAVSASAPLDDILAAEKALAFRLFQSLGINLTPAQRAAVEQRPTQNLAALLAYSRGVRAEVGGDYGAAASEFGNALRLDASFALAGTRLQAVQLRTPPPAQVAAAALSRATSMAVEHVNGVFSAPVGGSHAGGAMDPAFPGTPTRTGTIVITITTIP